MQDAYEIIIAIIASLTAAIIYARLSTRVPYIAISNSPNISGVWIGRVPYEHKTDIRALDIIRISEINGNIRFYKEHHDDKYKRIVKLSGRGIYRSPYLSAFYYFNDKKINHNGVFSLRATQVPSYKMALIGVYSQLIEHDTKEGRCIKPVTEKYELVRVTLGIKHQLRRFFIGSYFKHFEEAEALYKNSCNA